jgi:hypothetical protein
MGFKLSVDKRGLKPLFVDKTNLADKQLPLKTDFCLFCLVGMLPNLIIEKAFLCIFKQDNLKQECLHLCHIRNMDRKSGRQKEEKQGQLKKRTTSVFWELVRKLV